MTRARIVRPPISRSGLSPPPIRRARPPARITPGTPEASVIAVAFWRAASGPCEALVKHVPFLERHGQCGIPRSNDGAAWIACRLAEYKAAPRDKTREAAIDGPRTIRTCRAMTITKLDLSGLKCPLPALKVAQSPKILDAGRSAGSALHRSACGDRHSAFGRGDRRPFGDHRARRARYRVPHRKVGSDTCIKAAAFLTMPGVPRRRRRSDRRRSVI